MVGLAYVGFIGLGVRSGLLGVAWPSIRADFDVPLDALGALLGPFSVGYLLGSFVSGRALVRWDLGVLLAASFAGMAIYLIGSALAPGWWLLLALGLPGGLGTGLVDAGMNTYVANRHGPREMNWLHASWGVGVTLSPLMMTAALTSGLGWRWGYAVSGWLLLALGIGYFATRRSWPSRAAVTQQQVDGGAGHTATMAQTLRLPVAWLSVLLFIVYTGVELGIGQWAFPLLVEARGLSTVEAGAAVSAYWAGLTLGRVFFGVVVAAIGVERLLRLCMLSVLLGLGILWIPTAPGVALAALAVLGLVQAPVFPALVTLTPDHFGSAHTANAVGFQVAASVVGGAGLPALIGWLAGAFGLQVIVPTLLTAAGLQIACYAAWSRNHRG
ncbi:MAG: MFS transporter [Chloroflexota bacterium]|nr:MFS transporter [Chloroflexota bacterium]